MFCYEMACRVFLPIPISTIGTPYLLAEIHLAAGSQGGYNLLVGTSERGTVAEAGKLVLPPFKHALLAFGGPKGLEDGAARDPALQGRQAADLFGAWLNTAPAQVMARLRPAPLRSARPRAPVSHRRFRICSELM